MRALVVYDRDGAIRDIVISQPDAPSLSLDSDPGHSVAEVEVPESTIDLEDEQAAAKALRSFRVEIGGEARLVEKSSTPNE